MMGQSKLAQAIINETIPEEDSAPGDFVAAVRDLEGTPEDVAIDLGQELADKAPLSGAVVQVVSHTKTNVFSEELSTATGTTAAVPGLIVNITPKFDDSILLIKGFVSVSAEGGRTRVRLFVDDSEIARGDESDAQVRIHSEEDNIDTFARPLVFMASYEVSSTSELEIDLRLGSSTAATRTFYVNRADDDSDTPGRSRPVSTITVMEIAQ